MELETELKFRFNFSNLPDCSFSHNQLVPKQHHILCLQLLTGVIEEYCTFVRTSENTYQQQRISRENIIYETESNF